MDAAADVFPFAFAPVRRPNVGDELNVKYRSGFHAVRVENNHHHHGEHDTVAGNHAASHHRLSRRQFLQDLSERLHAIDRNGTRLALAYHNFGLLWHRLPPKIREHVLLIPQVKQLCVESFVLRNDKPLPNVIQLFGYMEYTQKEARNAVKRNDLEQATSTRITLERLLMEAQCNVAILRDCMDVLCRVKMICSTNGDFLVTKKTHPQRSTLKRAWEAVLPEMCFEQEEEEFN